MIDGPSGQHEPGRTELRLKPEAPRDILGRALAGGEDNEEDHDDLPPKDFRRDMAMFLF